MNRPRIVRWAVVGGICLSIAVGLTISRKRDRQPLPAGSSYANLPEIFNQTLRRMRDEVRAHEKDPEAIRKLARLYQANRLYREARACYALVAAGPEGLSARRLSSRRCCNPSRTMFLPD